MSAPDFTGASWRKSTRSNANGDCVEVACTAWRKSTRSNGNGNCVEVGSAPTHAGVRDSKNPTGPVLAFPHATWTTFLGTR